MPAAGFRSYLLRFLFRLIAMVRAAKNRNIPINEHKPTPFVLGCAWSSGSSLKPWLLVELRGDAEPSVTEVTSTVSVPLRKKEAQSGLMGLYWTWRDSFWDFI